MQTTADRKWPLPRLGVTAFRHAFRFSGRATRSEIMGYWLLVMLATIPLMLLRELFGSPGYGAYSATDIAFEALTLLLLLPFAALMARRAHDCGFPGLPVALCAALALVWGRWNDWTFHSGGELFARADLEWLRGILTLVVLALIIWSPTRGSNCYGPDPRLDAPEPAQIPA